MKKAHKKSISSVARLYRDNPGNVLCETSGGGENVFTWQGGEIAAVSDHCVAPVVWLDNIGALPWKLEWIEHDELNKWWYIKKRPAKDDKP